MAASGRSLAEEEYERLRKKYLPSFKMLDKNKDGFITTNEVAAMFETIGLSPCKSKIRQMLHNASLRGRHGIDFDEFIIAMERMERRGDVEGELRAAFSLVDQDKDERISKQEIFRVIEGLGEKITERQFNCLMREADTNKDGFLNFEEFKALMKKYGWGKDD